MIHFENNNEKKSKTYTYSFPNSKKGSLSQLIYYIMTKICLELKRADGYDS